MAVVGNSDHDSSYPINDSFHSELKLPVCFSAPHPQQPDTGDVREGRTGSISFTALGPDPVGACK